MTTATLNKFQSYREYESMVIRFSEKGSTTGEINEKHVEATKLNAQRMKRIFKQTDINVELKNTMENTVHRWTWLVIAESWCGDGAQNIPIIARMAELSPAIKLKIILRDENSDIMNAYLTNGSRSIPKLICFDTETNEEIGMWGSRPSSIQQKVIHFKKENPGASHEELVKNIHLWYAKDKGESLQNDFLTLIEEWGRRV